MSPKVSFKKQKLKLYKAIENYNIGALEYQNRSVDHPNDVYQKQISYCYRKIQIINRIIEPLYADIVYKNEDYSRSFNRIPNITTLTYTYDDYLAIIKLFDKEIEDEQRTYLITGFYHIFNLPYNKQLILESVRACNGYCSLYKHFCDWFSRQNFNISIRTLLKFLPLELIEIIGRQLFISYKLPNLNLLSLNSH